jgi:hypothetical protein
MSGKAMISLFISNDIKEMLVSKNVTTFATEASLENQSEQHRAFVAFAGGGAKGIIHVGALKRLLLSFGLQY